MGYNSKRPHQVPLLPTKIKIPTAKIGQYMNGKILFGLMSFHLSCDIWIVGSEFRVNNTKEWLHPALYQQFRLVLV